MRVRIKCIEPEEGLRLARRFIELSAPDRRSFLEALHEAGVQFAQLPILSDIDGEDRNKLSPAQLRIWSVWERDRDSAVWNVSCATRLMGRLNVPAFHRAMDSVIARHEILSTAFTYEPGAGPRAAPATRLSRVVHTDMRALPRSQRERCVKALAEHHASQPFDLANGPLLRVDLLKLTDHERVLLLCMHRLISDQVSLQVLVDALMHCYRAYEAGGEPDWEPLPIQYYDYALWQRRRLEAATVDVRPEVATAGYCCACIHLSIDAALTERLRVLARRRQLALFTVLTGTFTILLSHDGDQTDVRIGISMSNRHRVETRELIGCLADLLVMRARVAAGMRVDEFLGGLERAQAAAQTDSDRPCAPDSSLVQVIYSHDAPPASYGPHRIGDGLTLSPLAAPRRIAECELSLNMYERGDQLHAVLTYATDRFDVETIERWREHWNVLLDSIAADPARRIGTLPRLAATQQRYALSS